MEEVFSGIKHAFDYLFLTRAQRGLLDEYECFWAEEKTGIVEYCISSFEDKVKSEYRHRVDILNIIEKIRYYLSKKDKEMKQVKKATAAAAAAAATTEKEKAASKWVEAAAAWAVTLRGGPSDPSAGPQHHQRRRRPRPHQKVKLKARRAEKRRQAREKEKEEKETKEKEKERPEEEENKGMDIPFRQN
ncbi:hypothetical protein H113_05651 [Trichophyton rubrum MR1459]|uniref:Uncharacterized protein n=4 Tax=Trichophyton TaxID=5550 RepID=A0A178EQ37_TRIRU|nr:uncharacterized protein TERG_08780 [Trichophyton rubrum CBS 118892]EGD87074.1 hypothetical protein TERG_08780 [Trichophyton rubrum CBS 118892]EZF93456.1 hypothetical protein H113_05651 [Trichophyton rubrum MR1459]KMQ49245.1 hypothetical protein HL42_0177 [Trichophyton rubrum]OAL62161.1 hypothetical protein A7C99_6736 [Trichophyton rubrum]